MIGIVDYGCGNLASISNMLNRVGLRSFICSDPAQLTTADRLILPGVGSFDYGISRLRMRGLDTFVRDQALAGKPVLGICLGMQMLADGSEEGNQPGLGLVSGYVRQMAQQKAMGLPVPHVGWNDVDFLPGNAFYAPIGAQRFYFTHSYQYVPADDADCVATTRYGVQVTAAIVRSNVAGVQFHPEKSHRYGMMLLAAFGGVNG